MQIISNTALISINETLIVQLISFLIFIYIINRIMIKPLRGVIAERDSFIERIADEITHAKKTIENIKVEIQTNREKTRLEAFEITKEMETGSAREASKLFAATREEIASIREETQIEVEHKVSEARKEIQKESVALSVRIMEKVLERKLVQ